MKKHAWDEFGFWLKNNRKLAQKIYELCEECVRQPFEGRGKPEGLKGNFSGYWSRRIDDEHRLIYKVTEIAIVIVSCKGHYSK